MFLLEVLSLEKLLEEGKKRYFFVLLGLSIILVNVHDTLYPIFFIICLPYLADIILSRIKILHLREPYKIEFSNLKNEKYLIILMFICIFTGFLTPLFGTAYTNMIECLSGVSTDFIAELQATKIFNEPLLLFFIVLIIGILSFTKTKVKLKDLLFVIRIFYFCFNGCKECIFYVLDRRNLCIKSFCKFYKSIFGRKFS